MTVKGVALLLVCVLSWLVLLPPLLIGGGIALFTYAVIEELAEILLGAETSPFGPFRGPCNGRSPMPGMSAR